MIGQKLPRQLSLTIVMRARSQSRLVLHMLININHNSKSVLTQLPLSRQEKRWSRRVLMPLAPVLVRPLRAMARLSWNLTPKKT